MVDQASAPSPVSPEPAHVSFQTTFHKTQVIIGNLTVTALFLKEIGKYVEEVRTLGLAAGSAHFATWFTIELVVALLINCFVLALPIAGLIHYFRRLAERTSR